MNMNVDAGSMLICVVCTYLFVHGESIILRHDVALYLINQRHDKLHNVLKLTTGCVYKYWYV